MQILLIISLVLVSLFLLWVFIINTSHVLHSGKPKKKKQVSAEKQLAKN